MTTPVPEIDELTGIANRRGVTRALEAALRDASESGDVVHLALIDVDGFKTYNDTHGHVVGDHVLRELAAVIAANAPLAVQASKRVARGADDGVVTEFEVVEELLAELVAAVDLLDAAHRDAGGVQRHEEHRQALVLALAP